MQEGYDDFSLEDYDSGCCLRCSNSSPGCLCLECSCTKCYWYSSPEEYDGEKGHCDKTDYLKERYKEKLREEQEEKNHLFLAKKAYYTLQEKNHSFLKDGSQWVTCQKCSFCFLLPNGDFNIIIGESPICDFCLKENAERYKEWKRIHKKV